MNTDRSKTKSLDPCLSVFICGQSFLRILGGLGVLAVIFSFGCAPSVSFTVHRDEFIGAPIVGFGAQINPYLYCTPNSGEVTEDNVKDLERKVLDLRPQHVRIFVMPKWWSGGEADVIAKDDPRIRQSMIRTIRLAQDAGASVNLTFWYGPFPDPDEAAKKFVDMLAGLIREEKLTAVKYVTIQNEPNGDESKISFETYNALYRGLDKHLRSAGLREQIKIIGGDLVYLNQEKWFKNLADNLSDVLDGYSVHIYWDYWDTAKLQRRISEIPPIVAALPEHARKPIYLMEFGVRGKRDDPKVEPGLFKDGRLITDTNVQAMQIAWIMLEAINRGYVASVQWDCYDAWYDRKMG